MNHFEILIVTALILKSILAIEPTCNTIVGGIEDQMECINSPKVKISNGVVNGKTVVTQSGKAVNAFLGIPFAEPPIGNLRFKRPVPYTRPFETDFDATNLPKSCSQEIIKSFGDFYGETTWNPNTPVSEDCLYLNVWVPGTLDPHQKTNVFFWIYGGGFFSGSSTIDIYNGASLAAESNAIVVSTQYRLGPLGFLYLGTEDAPGNQGLLDQNLALQWVQKNIESFGGNPSQVTIFGESAGAASTSYHILSSMSHNLFKRAVLMSGVATASWAFEEPAKAMSHAIEIGKLANCSEPTDTSKLVQCLRKLNISVLTKLQFDLPSRPLSFPMTPTVDSYFLTDTPRNLLHNGKLETKDILIGNVLDEGSYFLPYTHPGVFSPFESSHVSNHAVLSVLHDYFQNLDEEHQDSVFSEYQRSATSINQELLNNEQLVNRAIGDAFFACPCQEFANLWSKRGDNVYYYMFGHETSSDPWGKWMGVKHGDEIAYFFGQPLNTADDTYTLEEQLLSKRMVSLLANFARTGVPSPEWNQCKTDVEEDPKFCPVYISSGFGDIDGHSRDNHCNFWNPLIPLL